MEEVIVRRLIGATVVVGLLVIFVPMVLEEEPTSPVANRSPVSEMAPREQPRPEMDPAFRQPATNALATITELSPPDLLTPSERNMASTDSHPVAEGGGGGAKPGTDKPLSDKHSQSTKPETPKTTEVTKTAEVQKPAENTPRPGAKEPARDTKKEVVKENRKEPVTEARKEPKETKKPTTKTEPAKAERAKKEPAKKEPTKATPPKEETPKVARTAEPPPKKTGERWIFQVASLSTRAKADAMADTLKSKGFPAFVEEARVNGKTYFRVRVGPRTERSEIDTLAAEVRDKTGQAGQIQRY